MRSVPAKGDLISARLLNFTGILFKKKIDDPKKKVTITIKSKGDVVNGTDTMGRKPKERVEDEFGSKLNERFYEFVKDSFLDLVERELGAASTEERQFFGAKVPRSFHMRMQQMAQDWGVTVSDVARLVLIRGIRDSERFFATHSLLCPETKHERPKWQRVRYDDDGEPLPPWEYTEEDIYKPGEED